MLSDSLATDQDKWRPPGFWALIGIGLIVIGILAVGWSSYYPTFFANKIAQQNNHFRLIKIQPKAIEKHGKYYSINLNGLGLISLAAPAHSRNFFSLRLLEDGRSLVPQAGMENLLKGTPGVSYYGRPNNKKDLGFLKYSDKQNTVRDWLFFVPYNLLPPLGAFVLQVPATSADAYYYSNSKQFRTTDKNIWWASIALMLIGSGLIAKNLNRASGLYYQFPFLLAVGATFYVMMAHSVIPGQWMQAPGAFYYLSSFALEPDSGSYLVEWNINSPRGPGYPWFIHALSNVDATAAIRNLPVGEYVTAEHPLQLVSNAQIFLLLGSGLTLMFVMMRVFNSPLPPLIFLALLRYHYFIWQELNHILTEPLMQACVLFAVTSCLGFFKTRNKWLLYITALFLGYAYLTRPAAIFASLILAAALLYALFYNWKRYWKHALGAGALYMAVFLVPNVAVFVQSGQIASSASSYQYLIIHALRSAQPADMDLLPTLEMKEWFADAIAIRSAADIKYDAKTGDNTYNKYIYRIQSAYEAAITRHPTTHGREFLVDISQRIFKERWLSYLTYNLNFVRITLFNSFADRISIGPLSSWAVYLGIIFLIAGLRSPMAFFAGFLVLSHLTHVLIMCLFAAPIVRMVWSTDILVFLALSLLVLELLVRLEKKYVKPWSLGKMNRGEKGRVSRVEKLEST